MKDKRPRIVIVDDNAAFSRDLKYQLTERGIIVEKTFTAGIKLLDHLATFTEEIPYTAVLVDFVLEDISGRELIDRLVSAYPQLEVIVMSGKNLQGSIQAYAMGAYAIMPKPVDYNELKFTLEELARRNRIADQTAEDMAKITDFDCVLVWELDWENYPNYKITGWTGRGPDRTFVEKTKMNAAEYPRVKALQSGKSIHYANIAREPSFQRQRDARNRGWVALLSFPFQLEEGRLLGWIDCYKTEEYHFDNDQDAAHKMGYLKRYVHIAGEIIQAERLKEQSRIIHETNQNLAGIQYEDLLYQSILEKSLAHTYADCAWIYRYLPEREEIVVAAEAGEGAALADRSRTIKQGGITGKVARTRISLYVRDVKEAEEGRYNPATDHVQTPKLKERSLMAVPLRRGERTLGVLTVMSGHPNFFLKDDLQFLTSLAAIAAVGMERQKLTHHLAEVSRRAQTARNFRQLSTYVVKAVKDLTDATVNLWMISEEDGEGHEFLRLIDSSMPALIDRYQPIPTAPDKSIAGKVLEKKEYELIPDLNEYDDEPPFVNQQVKEALGWRSLLMVPLLGKSGEKLGVLSCLHTDITKFSDDDGTLIQHFANQSALALQEQRHLEVLQELARIGQELTTTLTDTKRYLQEVVDMACRISKAGSVVIYPYDRKRKLFYANEFNVAGGTVLFPKNKLTSKPRERGLTALIRQHRAIRVEQGAEHEPLRIFTGSINRTQKPCYPEDELYQRALQFVKESRFIERENIQSFIGVSLVAKIEKSRREEVAVMYFNYRVPMHFSEEELRVINIFCNQVANVIHRNRLFNELEEERKLIEGVHQSALSILEERAQSERLDKIVREATQLLGGEGGKLYLTVNGSQKDLKLVAQYNLPEKYMQVGDVYLRSENTSMALQVAKTGKPLIENSYRDSEYKVPRLAAFFSSVVEVPLLIRENVIGVLGVFDNRDDKTFSQASVRVLERLAAQAALAINNVRLLEELDALYQTGLEISQNRGLPQMAKSILEQLKRVIAYDRATLQIIPGPHEERETLAHVGEKEQAIEHDFVRSVKEDPLIWPIYQQQEGVILSDTHRSSLWNKEYEATKDVRSWAGIPLVTKGRVLGILMLDHTQPGFYTHKDLDRLRYFASQAAIGINNALNELIRLKVLNDFAQSVQTGFSSKQEVVKALTDALSIVHLNDEGAYAYLAIDKQLLRKDDLPESVKYNGFRLSKVDRQRIAEQRSPEIRENGKAILLPFFVGGDVAGILRLKSRIKIHDNFGAVSATLLSLAGEAMFKLNMIERRVQAYQREFNPYITGSPIHEAEAFFGREEVTAIMLNQIHNNHFLILGERRIGKTSLLFHLQYQLQRIKEKKYLFRSVFMNLEATKEKEFWKHFMDTLQSLTGKAHSPKGRNYDFEAFNIDLKKTLAELREQAGNRKLRIVILMDEIDVFRTYDLNTMAKLRRVFQEFHEFKVVMAGVSFSELAQDIQSAWYNQLTLIELGVLQKEQARLLITQPVVPLYSFTEEAVALILSKSERKPLNIQLFCAGAVQRMLRRVKKSGGFSRGGLEIGVQDVPKRIKIPTSGKAD